ncbi:hypothetical protein HMI55_004506, partial [Coelomomyces lativittatus]
MIHPLSRIDISGGATPREFVTYTILDDFMKASGQSDFLDLELKTSRSVRTFFPCGTDNATTPHLINPNEPFSMNISVANPHGGGSCQFALSYDNETFVVFHQILDTCLKKETHLRELIETNVLGKMETFTEVINEFTINFPKNLPGGKAILSWSWITNDPENRNYEFYHSCLDIIIKGERKGNFTGSPMVVANYNKALNVYKKHLESAGNLKDELGFAEDSRDYLAFPGDSKDYRFLYETNAKVTLT